MSRTIQTEYGKTVRGNLRNMNKYPRALIILRMSKVIQEIHECNLELLKMFDALCNKYNLRYFIHAGTLLGAVRHGDFIPWDDDVDIVMFRADYEKLCLIPDSEYPEDFRLITPGAGGVFLDFIPRIINQKYSFKRIDIVENIDKYPGIEHPGLDIMILDASYTGLRHRIHTVMQLFIYALGTGHRADTAIKLERFRMIIKPIQWIGKRMSLTKIYRWYDDLSKRSKNKKVLFVSNNVPSALYREYDASWFEDSVLLEVRGFEFKAPVGYINALKVMFNDYLTLPPEEMRKPDHFDITDNQD